MSKRESRVHYIIWCLILGAFILTGIIIYTRRQNPMYNECVISTITMKGEGYEINFCVSYDTATTALEKLESQNYDMYELGTVNSPIGDSIFIGLDKSNLKKAIALLEHNGYQYILFREEIAYSRPISPDQIGTMAYILFPETLDYYLDLMGSEDMEHCQIPAPEGMLPFDADRSVLEVYQTILEQIGSQPITIIQQYPTDLDSINPVTPPDPTCPMAPKPILGPEVTL